MLRDFESYATELLVFTYLGHTPDLRRLYSIKNSVWRFGMLPLTQTSGSPFNLSVRRSGVRVSEGLM